MFNTSTDPTILPSHIGIACMTSADGQPVSLYTQGQAPLTASTGSPIPAFTPTITTIGGDTTTTQSDGSFMQVIYALIAYNRVLTDSERQYVINGLNVRYQVF